jgi:hypothetical protein
MLLAPRLYLLAHRTGARDEREQAHVLLQAQPQRALTVGLAVRDNATHPVEAERHTLLNRHGGLWAVTGMAVAHAQAEREAITVHAETQEHLLAIIMPIFAMPIGRTWGDRALRTVGVRGTGVLPFLIGPIERDRGRVLMEPGGWNGIHLQGMQCHSPKHPVQMGRKQGIEDLAQPVIVQRRGGQARLQEGQHPSLLQTRSHLREGMMAIKNREEQSLDPTATREDIGGVRRTEGINERSHLELAYYPEHSRQVGHGANLMNRDRHEGLLLHVLPEGTS